MEVVDVPDPGPAAAGCVVVRPEAVGICGSDFHYFHGNLGTATDDDSTRASRGTSSLRSSRTSGRLPAGLARASESPSGR